MTGAPTGLYIHVPFCDGKCPYCAFYSVGVDPARARRWLAAVQREYARFAEAHGAPVFDTVYIGGGTPSRLEPDLVEALIQWVARLLPPGGAAEWSLEVNPGSARFDTLARIRRAGVNRLSIGAQSFDPVRLKRLGRRHDPAAIVETVRAARAAGFDNVGLDLIAGGPRCGARTWQRTLESALALEPAHLSIYALTVEEGTALARAVGQGRMRLSDAATVARLHEAQRRLERAGYTRYEISNYARPGYVCRHHAACWRGARYLGLGPAAASHVGMARWTNAADLAGYLERLEAGGEPARETETLSPAAKAAERLVFGLRLAEGVDLDEVLAEGGDDAWRSRWTEQMTAWIRRGMMVRNGPRWALTRRGMDWADRVAVDLMP